MVINSLSRSERLTLYGLVRYPELSDRLLSGELGLRSPTVTAARNRLRSAGWYRVVRIPVLDRLGGELLCAGRARLNVLRPREALVRSLRGALAEVGSVFYAVADRLNLLSLSICTSYTDAWSDSERLYSLLMERDALAPGSSPRHAVILPLSRLSLIRFFDFAAIAHQSLGIQGPPPEPALGLAGQKGGSVRLSRVEGAVLYALVRYPELTDSAVARRAGVARQSVTRIRKRLSGEGLLRTIAVPDIRRLGPDILAFSVFDFRPGSSMSERGRAMQWAVRVLPAFLHISGGGQGMVMGLVQDFSTLQKICTEVLKVYMEKGYFIEEPQLTLLSVRELSVVKDLAFAPIVKKALELED